MIFDWTLSIAGVVAVLAAAALGVRVLIMRRTAALRAENQRLCRQVEELTTATHARIRFLAMMSHEIRTPLTGIVGFAEVLADEPLSTGGRRSLNAIQRSANALQSLLGDILDFSRIDAGALPIQRRPVDIAALLHEVRDEFAPQARQRGLAFGLSVDESARRWTATDPLRFRQIVVNLVSNAIRYTESGLIQVTAAADPTDDQVIVVRVSDTGLGIAPEDCTRIFDAFAQAAARDSRRSEDGGVGLGLAIANGLVRAMRGSLALESTLGHGSTFTVRLPLPACAPAPDTAPARGTATAPAQILLVDDVAMNRELFAAMLRREGHGVVTAEDGDTALRCLAAERFDLAFIDIQMPFMDGLELTRRIRASTDSAVAAMPIVALSAAAYGEDRDRAAAAGMNGYVTKPATRDDIAAAVAAARRSVPATLPPQAPAAPADEVLDRAIFDAQRDTFGDDRVRRFLALLGEELQRRRAALEEAARDSDRAALARHAHAVASSASNLGFAALLATGRRLEAAFADLPEDAVAPALGELYAAIDACAATIETLDAELSGGRDARLATG